MDCQQMTNHSCGRRMIRLLLCAFIMLGWAVSARCEGAIEALNTSGNRNLPVSIDPIEDEEGYSAILYDSSNGLPTSEANAIAQTEEGFIWIGSYAGLIRYDGINFERIASDTGILNTRCLYVDSLGRLWIGTNDLGLYLMSGDSLDRVDQPNKLKSISIRAIAEDSAGGIWVGSAMGVFTVDADMGVTVLDDARIATQTIVELRPGRKGLVYGTTMNGDLFVLKDGAVQDYLTHVECGLEGITAILPDLSKPGMLYIATEDSGTHSVRIHHGATEDHFASAESVNVRSLSFVERMEYIDGGIWLCAGNGSGRLDGERFRLLKNVPMDKSVGHVMTDHEGNLWFTSSRQCVMKIAPNRFLDISGRYALPEDVVNSTCVQGGRLFIGTDASGLIVVENGVRLDALPVTEAATASGVKRNISDLLDYLKDERIRSIFCDSRDRLWFCTWQYQRGLVRYDHGRVTTFTTADGLLSNRVRTVSECADGSILVAQPEGVSVLRDDIVVESYGAPEGIDVTSILTVTEGFDHELILGTDGGGIYVVTPEGMLRIGVEDGLKSEVILRIKPSRTGDVYWIATGNSIAYMTRDYQVTTVERFPFSNNYDFFENSRGELWVLSSNGIYVVPTEQLLENNPVDARYYGTAAGLPYIATSNSFSALTADGDLFMAGIRGVVRFNIERSCQNAGIMKLALPWIDIDGRRTLPEASGDFIIPRGARKVTIYPHVFSFLLTDPRVTYRLEGFDPADITVDRSALEPVTYTNLRAGSYRFTLRADAPDGGDSVSATYRLIKEKALTEGGYGSIIMDIASLFLLGGLMAYTSLYRKRGSMNDRLLFSMMLVNISLAVVEAGGYLTEGGTFAFARELLYLEHTLYYVDMVLFPCVMLCYVESFMGGSMARLRKMQLMFGIPCALFFVLLAVNLKTGWIFSITERNAYQRGPVHSLAFFMVAVCFAVSLTRIVRGNRRLALIAGMLIIARAVWDMWYVDISSLSFIYTLFLVCVYMLALDISMAKEVAL